MRSVCVRGAHGKWFSGVYRCKARGESCAVGIVLHTLQTYWVGRRDTLRVAHFGES